MFTGIVEEMGRLRSRRGSRFVFEATEVLGDLTLGASVAHNGCCLTVVEIGDGWYGVDVVEESLRRTNLGDLHPGDLVNLERPLRLADRLGGHLVQGHVDAVGEILRAAPDLWVSLAPGLARFVVDKGSITVVGCSLTVVEAGLDRFSVAVIPHTCEVTTLGSKAVGERVNLEVDMVAKYIERLMSVRPEADWRSDRAPGREMDRETDERALRDAVAGSVPDGKGS